jgi:hypothetical protein
MRFVVFGGSNKIYDWIKECEEKFGERPEDLTVGFVKD